MKFWGEASWKPSRCSLSPDDDDDDCVGSLVSLATFCSSSISLLSRTSSPMFVSAAPSVESTLSWPSNRNSTSPSSIPLSIEASSFPSSTSSAAANKARRANSSAILRRDDKDEEASRWRRFRNEKTRTLVRTSFLIRAFFSA